MDTGAGIDRDIVDNTVDRALFPTVDKHASLWTVKGKIYTLRKDYLCAESRNYKVIISAMLHTYTAVIR